MVGIGRRFEAPSSDSTHSHIPDRLHHNADVPLNSFTDLHADVTRRRAAGDVDGAVALLRENVKTFPLHRGVVYLVLAETLVTNGQPKEALDALQEAFTVGCRYKS